ncbi:MAG: SLC13 family permease [archaeon]
MIEIDKNLKIMIATFFIAFLITLIPFPAQFTLNARIMIAIAFIAVVFWVTECIPIPVTALLVILMQGLFGIMPFADSFSYIAHPVNALIIAGFVIAGSLKKYGLDKRIGLKIVSFMGDSTNQLVLGVMIATAFLSMWISNTAATAIMIPIGIGVLKKASNGNHGNNMSKVMVIGTAFAANIGGIGTPLGTPPVPITIGFLNELAGISISFFDWIVRAIPIVIILIPVTWKLLTIIYPPEIKKVEGGMKSVKKELIEMGKFTKKQKHVVILFIIAIILWFLDSLGFILPLPENWIYLASLIIALMYVFPGVGVLSWKEAEKEINWGILILIGGGLALGSGLQKAGVIEIIARYMESFLIGTSLFTVIAAVALITAFSITLFSSLTATSSTFVPVAIALAMKLDLSPLLLALVAGVASCFAFLLPVNTPPNAISYDTGYFKTT